MLCGSFDGMVYRLCTILLVVFALPAAGQVANLGADTTLLRLYEKDDLENFTYSVIDRYLAEPVADRLVLFDDYEDQVWRPRATGAENLAYVILLCNKGYYYTRFGDLYRGVEAYEKAWRLFADSALTGYDITEYCLKPLGNTYSMLGDYANAESVVKNYLLLAERDQNVAHILGALINLAIVYHDTGRYDEAIALLRQGMAVQADAEKPQAYRDKLGLLYAGLATNYLAAEDMVMARRWALLSRDAIHRYAGADSVVQLVNTYALLGAISLAQHRMNEALFHIQSARALAAGHAAMFRARDMAKLLNRYGEILLMRGRHREAIRAYRQALALLVPGYDAGKAGSELPDVSQYYAENAIKEALDGLAAVYMDTGQPVKVLACFDHSFQVEDLLRATYATEAAKLQQQLETRSRTEWALGVLYTLLQRTRDGRYAERAFALAERTKAVVLRDAVEDQYVRQQLGRDSLVIQEGRLHYIQATLAAAIAEEQLRHERADVAYIQQLMTRQSRTTLALHAVRRAIDANYPAQLPGAQKALDVPALQRRLARDKALLVEYFMGKEAAYVFRVDGDTLLFEGLPDVSDVKKRVADLNRLFADPSAINNNITTYKQAASTLYTLLHLPGPAQGAGAGRLILIPDGVLHTIPFDALLYERASGTNYASFPYLLKRFTIAYQASAALYMRYTAAPVVLDRRGLLAMFPVFEKTGRVLAYSLDEGEAIERYMDGEFLYRQKATKHAFLEEASGYPVIHLSTHASAGGGAEPPSIAFADSTVYLPQVYGLALDTDLLVLSACETGVGPLVRGEGAISLARGFQLAGVRNLIFSLWNVNDYSTAVLMGRFYEYYTKTGSKARALQQARLAYLADAGVRAAYKSPYYWAGFVYYGSVETQHVSDSMAIRSTVLVGIAVVILLSTGMYVWRRRRRISP